MYHRQKGEKCNLALVHGVTRSVPLYCGPPLMDGRKDTLLLIFVLIQINGNKTEDLLQVIKTQDIPFSLICNSVLSDWCSRMTFIDLYPLGSHLDKWCRTDRMVLQSAKLNPKFKAEKQTKCVLSSCQKVVLLPST